MSESSIVSDPAFPGVLLAHLVHVKQFLSRAVKKLEPKDFSQPGETAHQLVLAVIQNYYTSAEACIPPTLMTMDINSRIKGAPGTYTPQDVSELQGLVTYLYSKDATENLFSSEYMIGQLQLFLNDRRILPKAAELARANPLDLDERLAALSREHAATRIASGAVMDDFFRPDKIKLVPQFREPIGVDFIDLLLGGGTTPGEVYGIIGPFGMGKTTLAVQAFCESCSRKRHSLYVLYEQPFHGDISNRMYGYMGKLTRSQIEGQTFETLHVDAQNKLKSALDPCWPYMHIADMVSDPQAAGGGPEGIGAILQGYEDKGIHIEVVYLDQYLPFIRAWMAATGQAEDRLRTVMEGTVYTFMGMSTKEKHNCCFFLLHQTSTEGAGRSATALPKPTDSAECKSFPFWLNTFIQLGVQDLGYRQWAVSGKGRAAAKDRFIVECLGAEYRYKYERDRYTVGSGTFRDPGKEASEYKTETVTQVDEEQSFYV